MIWLLLGALVLLLWTWRGLGGKDLSRWDEPPPPPPDAAPSPEHGQVVALLRGLLEAPGKLRGRARLQALRGCLAGLPPVLLQVSEQEMLLDDSRRYVARAQAAGSPVELQSWPQLVHVWQIFTPELPEAEEAWLNVAEFLSAAGLPTREGALA